MKYRLAIFDMDGTILDTLRDLADTMNHALQVNGFPVRALDEIRQFVGNGIGKLVERAVPDGTSEAEIKAVRQDFDKYYKEHCADTTCPYDGIPQLLSDLKANGCRVAVVSNKADDGVQELCERYFDGVFDAAVGERQGIARKPSPDSVNEVLKLLNCSKEESVYIGDSDVDIDTAKNAGMDCIVVGWGFRDREFLFSKGAETYVTKPEEIFRIIAGSAKTASANQ